MTAALNAMRGASGVEDPMAALVPFLIIVAALTVALIRQWRDDRRDPPAGKPW